MANRFWVGGTASWDATAGTKWATTTGGAGGAAVPTSADDVFFDAASGAVVVTVAAASVARSVDCLGFTGTIAGSNALAIGTNSAPASNIALRLVAGMTWSYTGTLSFSNTGAATPQTITTANKTFTTITVNGAAGRWKVVGTLTVTGTFTFNSSGAAFFDLDGNSWVVGTYTGSTGASKTLTLGAALVSWSVAWTATAGNVSADLATLQLVGASTAGRTFAGGGKTYGSLIYQANDSPGSLIITGANTFGTLNVGARHRVSLPASTTQTVRNLTISGTPYGYQRVTAAGSIWIADSAALSLQNDMDLRARVQLDSYATGAVQALIAKRNAGGASTASYQFSVNATGSLTLLIGSGAANATATSSVTLASISVGTSGDPVWLRATRRISDGRVQFWWADGNIANPVTSDWAQVGSNQTNSNAGQDTADPVFLGGFAAAATNAPSLPMIGNYFRAQIRNNVLDDGTGIQLDVNFTNIANTFAVNSFVESSGNAATVTKHDLAQPMDGRVHIFSSTGATPATIALSELKTIDLDYMRVVDSTLTGSPVTAGTAFAGSHSVDGTGNTGWVFTDPPATSGDIIWTGSTHVKWTGDTEATWTATVVASGYGNTVAVPVASTGTSAPARTGRASAVAVVVAGGNGVAARTSQASTIAIPVPSGNAFPADGGIAKLNTVVVAAATGVATRTSQPTTVLIPVATALEGAQTRSTSATTAAVATAAATGARSAAGAGATIVVAIEAGAGAKNAISAAATIDVFISQGSAGAADRTGRATDAAAVVAAGQGSSARTSQATTIAIPVAVALIAGSKENPGSLIEIPLVDGTGTSARTGSGAVVAIPVASTGAGTAARSGQGELGTNLPFSSLEGSANRTGSASAVQVPVAHAVTETGIVGRASTVLVAVAAATSGPADRAGQAATVLVPVLEPVGAAHRTGYGAVAAVVIVSSIGIRPDETAFGFGSLIETPVASARGVAHRTDRATAIAVPVGAASGARAASERARTVVIPVVTGAGPRSASWPATTIAVPVVDATAAKALSHTGQLALPAIAGGVGSMGGDGVAAAVLILLVAASGSGIQTDADRVVMTLAVLARAQALGVQARAQTLGAHGRGQELAVEERIITADVHARAQTLEVGEALQIIERE